MCHPDNLPDIILKALVQHPVCLIKDQVADPFQVQATHVYQVLQPRIEVVVMTHESKHRKAPSLLELPSRSCDHDLSSPSQGLALLPLGNPSIAANWPKGRKGENMSSLSRFIVSPYFTLFASLLHHLLALHGQLPRGGQNQHNWVWGKSGYGMVIPRGT